MNVIPLNATTDPKCLLDLFNIIRPGTNHFDTVLNSSVELVTSPQFIKKGNEYMSEEQIYKRCISFGLDQQTHKENYLVIQELINKSKPIEHIGPNIKKVLANKKTIETMDKLDGVKYIANRAMPDSVIIYLEDRVGDCVVWEEKRITHTENEEGTLFKISERLEIIIDGNVFSNNFRDLLLPV